jgi:hypothetical protein
MNPLELAWSQACICGRIFSVPQAYSHHKQSCLKTKKRLSDALASAKEVWQIKKHRKGDRSQVVECSLNENVAAELSLNDGCLQLVHPQVRFHAGSALSLIKSLSLDSFSHGQRRGSIDSRWAESPVLQHGMDSYIMQT